ncbi:DUF1751-domain-containing protein [Ramicandelaber brevisporus]|nr:DUF1751-domain-containing protein [Ramicandelaber brevisporus]
MSHGYGRLGQRDHDDDITEADGYTPSTDPQRWLWIKDVPLATKVLSALIFLFSLIAIALDSIYLRHYWASTPDGASPTTQQLRTLAVNGGNGKGDEYILPSDEEHTRVQWIVLSTGGLIARPWTFFTSPLTETGPLSFAMSFVSSLVYGGFLERRWGSKQFAIFVFVTLYGAEFVALVCTIMSFAVHRNIATLYTLRIHGTMPLLLGALVALKQAIPEHVLALFGSGSGSARGLRIRVKHLPVIGLGIVAFPPLLFGYWHVTIYGLAGFVISWVYLRFFQQIVIEVTSFSSPLAASDMTGGLRPATTMTSGDLSEEFSFASFFPESVRPAVKPATDAMYSGMVRIGAVRPIAASAAEEFDRRMHADLNGATLQDAVPMVTIHSSDQGETATTSTTVATSKITQQTALDQAERRRALALKMLERRKAEKQKSDKTSPTATASASEQAEATVEDSIDTEAVPTDPPNSNSNQTHSN